MAIANSDLSTFYSGGATNADPNASLGGIISNTATAGSINQLFDNVTYEQSLSGHVDYRCFYFKNTSTTETLYEAITFIQQNTPSPDGEIEIGLDPAGVGDGSTTGVATTIADEEGVPSGVVFSSPMDVGTGISIGDLAPETCIAIWVKRTMLPGAQPAADDSAIIRLYGLKAPS